MYSTPLVTVPLYGVDVQKMVFYIIGYHIVYVLCMSQDAGQGEFGQ